MKKIAIVHQAEPPPSKDGSQKPMKEGGYSDSGADIAYELQKNGIEIVLPVDQPDLKNDFDWVFPDTKKGIQSAIDKGADVFWLNTVLYKNHAIEPFFEQDIECIGQLPETVDRYDDKLYTNQLLAQHQMPIPKTQLIFEENINDYVPKLDFPMVVKPIRGRGSQGVFLVATKEELDDRLRQLFSKKSYGNSVYLEQYLPGQEITITVMPPGQYTISNQNKLFEAPWCLPAVRRFNHHHGIAPYNGIVAVMENSAVLSDDELASSRIQDVYDHCKKAAALVGIKAPIRIDCRADGSGKYFLFDLNMKPNMTGPSRAHRNNQDSLTLLAARKIGWTYADLLKNMINLRWKGDH